MKTIAIQVAQTEACPADVGFHAPQLEKLDALFCRLIETEKLQCASYLLSRYGKVFACKSMGRLLYNDDQKPLLPDSIRRLASITKVFTATGIMQLIEQGKLYLEQPVKDIIREFDTDMHGKINLEHLLTHTSGLAPDPGFCLEPYPRPFAPAQTIAEFIQTAVTGVPRFQPGECWEYNTTGIMLLGEIISRISGMPYTEFIRHNILIPSGMTDSHFTVPADKQQRLCLVSREEEEWLNSQWPDSLTAGFGLFSTLHDLWRFGQAMLDARILGRKTIEKMTSDRLQGVPTNAWGVKLREKRYGLGWSLAYRSIVSPSTYDHEGAGRVALVIDPEEQLVAAYFVPSTIGWVAESQLSPLGIVWAGII